nr:hypothetical protein [Streptomyces sp. CRN 30]
MQQPGGGEDGRDGASAIPDGTWQRFAEDSEHAILRSAAPREPSARERAGLRDPWPPETDADVDTDADADADADAVGELWQPEDRWARPARRTPDGRTGRRRTGRVLGTAAAVAVLLVLLDRPPSGPAGPYGGQTDAVTQQDAGPRRPEPVPED